MGGYVVECKEGGRWKPCNGFSTMSEAKDYAAGMVSYGSSVRVMKTHTFKEKGRLGVVAQFNTSLMGKGRTDSLGKLEQSLKVHFNQGERGNLRNPNRNSYGHVCRHYGNTLPDYLHGSFVFYASNEKIKKSKAALEAAACKEMTDRIAAIADRVGRRQGVAFRVTFSATKYPDGGWGQGLYSHQGYYYEIMKGVKEFKIEAAI